MIRLGSAQCRDVSLLRALAEEKVDLPREAAAVLHPEDVRVHRVEGDLQRGRFLAILLDIILSRNSVQH